MNNPNNYKKFMDKKDGDKVLLVAVCNNTPVSFMMVRDLTEREDKNASVQITHFYSNQNVYMAITYCHFYKWFEEERGHESLIRLESPKKDLYFYKEMNMVMDEEWNVIDGTNNNRMAKVGINEPPYDRYKVTLKKTIDKENKSSHLR